MCRASWHFAKSATGEPNATEQIKKAGTPTVAVLRIMSILAAAVLRNMSVLANDRPHSGQPTARPADVAVLRIMSYLAMTAALSSGRPSAPAVITGFMNNVFFGNEVISAK
jgi:hypothetical protein